jgi:CYTH domain-containing protein
LISSIYLSEDDFSALKQGLAGVRLTKTRYRLQASQDISMCLDEFEGPLSGLLIAEAEFADDKALARFDAPQFAIREITGDSRFSGYSLASEGIPPPDA